jgi:hypothetical protein
MQKFQIAKIVRQVLMETIEEQLDLEVTIERELQEKRFWLVRT